MASQIRITPQELRDGATTLTNQKEQCMEILSSMKSKVDEVAGNWEGAAQNAFIAQFEELYKNISEALPNTVEGITEMLKSAAQTLEDADSQIASALKGK